MAKGSKNSVVDGRKRGFTTTENDIVDTLDLDIYEKVVYWVLSRFVNRETKACFPNYKTIAEKARCSERKAIDAINGLVKKGYIEKEVRNSGKSGKGFMSNLYRLVDPPTSVYNIPIKESSISSEDNQDDCKDTTKNGLGSACPALGVVQDMHQCSARHAPGVVQDMHQCSARHAYEQDLVNKTNNNNTNTNNPLSSFDDAPQRDVQSIYTNKDFMVFWNQYPKTICIDRAFIEWEKVLSKETGLTPIDLSAAAGKYAVYVKSNNFDQQYVKAAHNFLSEGMYLQYLVRVTQDCPKCKGAGWYWITLEGEDSPRVQSCGCRDRKVG